MGGSNKSPVPKSPASTATAGGTKKPPAKKPAAKKSSSSRKPKTKASKKTGNSELAILQRLREDAELKVLDTGASGVIDDNENDVLYGTDVNIEEEEQRMVIKTELTSMSAAERDLAYWPNTHIVGKGRTKEVLATAGSKLTPPITLPNGKLGEEQIEYLSRSFQEFLSSVLPEVAAIARYRHKQRKEREEERRKITTSDGTSSGDHTSPAVGEETNNKQTITDSTKQDADNDVSMKDGSTSSAGDSMPPPAKKAKKDKYIVTMADLDALRQTSRTLPSAFERKIVEAMLTPNTPPKPCSDDNNKGANGKDDNNNSTNKDSAKLPSSEPAPARPMNTTTSGGAAVPQASSQ